MAIRLQYANFQIFSGGACPRTILELYLVLKLLKIKSAEINCACKSDKNWCPLLQKISEYAPDMKHFQKVYLRPFRGLNVFAFS